MITTEDIRPLTKQQLHKKLHETPIRELRQIINEIIAKNRGRDIEEIKSIKTVRINEVKEVYKELGYF